MAIANRPKLLVADEPTTALDVTIQAQVLEVLREIQQATGTAMIVITHDVGVIAELADTVVAHDGRVVEHGPVGDVFHAPSLPHTARLLARRDPATAAAPVPGGGEQAPVLVVDDLVTHLPSRRRQGSRRPRGRRRDVLDPPR